MFLLMAAASAGELNFSPDRPGIGDSTATVGQGHLMVEGGLTLALDPTSGGTSGWIGRIGLDQGVELRLRAPDLILGDGFALGPVGIGGKFAGSTGEHWAVSLVPELTVLPDGGSLGGSIGGNVSFSIEDFGAWAHAGTAVSEDGVGLFAGGGVSYGFGPGGLYLNAGGDFGGNSVAGGGAWFSLGDAFQLDAGCDVFGIGADLNPVFGLGMSVGI